MDEPTYEYITVFDDVLPPDPVPIRLLRRWADDPDHEEMWVRPGAWRRSTYLADLRFGHGDGTPEAVSAEAFAQWQQEFTAVWRARAERRDCPETSPLA